MVRLSLGLLLAIFTICWTAQSASAQMFYQTPNGAIVAVAPVVSYPYYYNNSGYWVNGQNFGRSYYGNRYQASRYPGRVTITRTQLDPQRQFFNGNGSSYSPGTSQIWSSPRR
ncbi:MAG: hypothetical protein U0930_06060 [Pirellulales bacterium]